MERDDASEPGLAASIGDGWRYWRPRTEGILELGALRGSAPGLATHFHADIQVTLVLAGRRSLLVGGRMVELSAGRCLCIPAGVPHASFAEPPDVVGLIAYFPAGLYSLDEIAGDIERSWVPDSPSCLADLAALVRRHRQDVGADVAPSHAASLSREPIGRLAARNGMSREGYSRQFARRSGMPPHAFRLAARLDLARALLRAGAAPADVAAETGFADQSHFGRSFKRAFGVSPGRYRQGRAVTNVPD